MSQIKCSKKYFTKLNYNLANIHLKTKYSDYVVYEIMVETPRGMPITKGM